MRNRIVITIVALVILPTALLSIMAGRAVRNRELVIMQQMKISAAGMVRLCSEEVESEIKEELTRIRSSIGSVLMRTASAAELARTARVIEDGSPIIDGVIIYHDPWDIIYPQGAPAVEPPAGPEYIELLRIEIARLRKDQEIFTVNDGGVYYCFTLVPNRKDLYAGFRVDLIGFRDALDRILDKLATDNIALSADGRMYEPDNSVIIEDSLAASPIRKRIEDTASPDFLARSPLTSPFTDVNVTAYARNPKELEATGRNQSRLLIWGIALLSGGILAGVIILIFQVHEEIRRTSARANYIIGISHDLRTPIASLKMMTESLYSGTIKNPEKQHRFLGTMAGECERLNRLVERVLYFVRFGEDALVFFKKTVSVKSIIEDTVKSFSASAGGGRQEVDFKVSASSSIPEIEADENALSQLLLNLLDNALKYGRSPGSAAQQISVSAEVVERKRRLLSPARSWIRISVADNGPGIEPTERHRIFKPYFRARTAHKANISGVGLGLALCRHIARAHGGWIEAGNGSTKGAVFSIYLPFAA